MYKPRLKENPKKKLFGNSSHTKLSLLKYRKQLEEMNCTWTLPKSIKKNLSKPLSLSSQSLILRQDGMVIGIPGWLS